MSASNHVRSQSKANAQARLFAAQRRQRILQIVERQEAATVSQLSRLLKISAVSIRRDLRELEQAGLLERTHGGALRNGSSVAEPSLAEKEVSNPVEKRAIARAALGMISGGETVMLDAGSTTLEMARHWKAGPDVTVVTNAVNLACELARTAAEPLVLGGTLREKTLALVGPIAQRTLADLHIDTLFLAANAVDLQKGVTTPNLAEAHIKQAMVASAKRVVLVCDHSKFGKVAFCRVCGIERLSCVVTDANTPRKYLREFQKRGVKVVVARGRK